MEKKLLITLPCNILELANKLKMFDRHDVVVCQYDGDGDSLYVNMNQVMEECEKPNAKPKDITKCKYRFGCHCGHETVTIKESEIRRSLSGMSPFICPFKDGNECKYYEPKSTDPIQQTNNFVQTLEAANKATEGSQMVFK